LIRSPGTPNVPPDPPRNAPLPDPAGAVVAPDLSVVLPVHNERENLAPLATELTAVLGTRPVEIIAVDDASTDGSAEELRRLAAADARWRVLRLPRRSGQSAALVAGWRAALLARLADDPRLVAAVGVRVGRRDGWWKLVQSRVANRVRDWLTGHRVQDTACGLKAMRRGALLRVPTFDGVHRFLPTLLVRDGGHIVEVPVAHRPRRHGRTKYGMWNRAWRGLRDALGVRWLNRRRLPPDASEVT
jgi:dolichol-phosphate mannosyltransferase